MELPSIVTGFVAQKHDGQPVRQPVRNLQIKNFRVVYRDNEEQVAIPQEFDEFLTDYPESNAHGDVDACGLWVRHADGVLLQDIQVTPRSCNTRRGCPPVRRALILRTDTNQTKIGARREVPRRAPIFCLGSSLSRKFTAWLWVSAGCAP